MRDDSRYCTGSHSGRVQSPAVEYAFEDSFAAAIKTICESKGLYQNVDVKHDFLSSLADDNWTIDALVAEFSKRPIKALTRKEHVSIGQRIFGGQLAGVDAIGTPSDQVGLSFYLPVAEVRCAVCKTLTPHTSVPAPPLPYETPFGQRESSTVQVLHVMFGCTRCTQEIVGFQIMRRGLRLQLTGRTTPFRPEVQKEWPKPIRDIIRDAFVAAAEGDIPAAFYHLRTAQEFFMKHEVGMNTTEKIDGQELCERYNKVADPRVIQNFPAMTMIYSALSEGLHTRSTSVEDFNRYVSDFLKHLKAKVLFAEISK